MPKPRGRAKVFTAARPSAAAAAGARAPRRTARKEVVLSESVLPGLGSPAPGADASTGATRAVELLPPLTAKFRQGMGSSKKAPSRAGEATASLPTGELAFPIGTVTTSGAPIVSSMFSEARKGDVEALRRLVGAGADPSSRSPELGRTALHHAAESGRVDVVKHLLEYPTVDINATTKDGWTALHSAAVADSSLVVGVLLADSRVLPNTVSKDGLTAYALAKRLGRSAAAAKLSANPRVKRGAAEVASVHGY